MQRTRPCFLMVQFVLLIRFFFFSSTKRTLRIKFVLGMFVASFLYYKIYYLPMDGKLANCFFPIDREQLLFLRSEIQSNGNLTKRG